MPPSQATIVRRYWDSTSFIAILNGEEDAGACERILGAARQGTTEVCVSPLVQVEVVRPKGAPTPLAEALRQKVGAFFENDYIKWRTIDRKISSDAQRLCWDHPIHPRDAIHLAVAIDLDCDLFETADDGLLNLDQRIPHASLRICRPGALDPPDLFSQAP